MAKSVKHRSKVAALYRQWWYLQMSKKILQWDEKLKRYIYIFIFIYLYMKSWLKKHALNVFKYINTRQAHV